MVFVLVEKLGHMDQLCLYKGNLNWWSLKHYFYPLPKGTLTTLHGLAAKLDLAINPMAFIYENATIGKHQILLCL